LTNVDLGSDANRPLVSIITPVFNGADYLEETLRSICASSYRNLELIVIDDGSTDDSARVARETLASTGRLFQVTSKPNSGEADSDNFGLERSRGEIIAFINADDPIDIDLVTKSVEVFEKNPNVIVTYPDWRMIDENGDFIQHVFPKSPTLELLVGDVQCLPGPGAFIRRSAIPSPELRKKKYRYVSDYEQWLSLSLQGEFYKIPEVLASWRRHSAQQTAAAQGKYLSIELVQVIEDFFRRTDLTNAVRSLEKQAKAQAHYQAAIQSLYGRGVPGKRLLLTSVFTVFRRRNQQNPERRNPLVALLILSNPLGRFYLHNHLRIKEQARNIFRKAPLKIHS